MLIVHRDSTRTIRGGDYDRTYARLERHLLQVAEAVSADQYSFSPTPEVRSFGEQLRHIGAAQFVVGAGLLNEQPPVDVGDGGSGPLLMRSKHEIVRYVADSFSYIRRAIQSMNDSNGLGTIPHPFDSEKSRIERLALIVGYASHGWEHYGQLVVYQQINGTVPPQPVKLNKQLTCGGTAPAKAQRWMR